MSLKTTAPGEIAGLTPLDSKSHATPVFWGYIVTDSGWSTLGLFATLIANLAFQVWRENHARKVARDNVIAASEERKAATAEIVAVAEANARALHIKTEAEADALKLTAKATADMLARKMDTVHVAAKEAFKEANDVNVKIANFNQRLIEQKPRSSDDKLDEIQATAVDTNEAVHRIDGKVKP